jgi:flagellar basal body rod protein FlgG
MSISGIMSSLSGLQVSEQRVSQNAHNLANLSTTGFSPGRVEQASLAGGGVEVSGITSLGAGPMLPSESPLDLAIDGGGFFVLDDGQGGSLYTRSGAFTVNNQGQLVDQMGRGVVPGIAMPPQTAQVHISAEGQFQALSANGQVLAQGQLQTAAFGNPGGLQAVGGNAFRETEASGPPVNAAPGTAGHGQLVSGALQGSGTDIATEMVNLTIDQRVFEANLKALRTQNEMVGSIIDVVG